MAVLAERSSTVHMDCMYFSLKILFSFSRYCWLGACVLYVQFVFPPATTAVGARSAIEKTNLSELAFQIQEEWAHKLGQYLQEFHLEMWVPNADYFVFVFCLCFAQSKQVKFNLNVFILEKKKKKEKQSSSLWGVIFSFTNPKRLTEEFWFLLSMNPLGLDLAVLFIIN